MGVHANAKLGPAGRRRLVELIRGGVFERGAEAALSVAPATAHRWSLRERQASDQERASGGLGAGSLESSPAFAAADRGGRRAAGLPGAAGGGLGAATDRRANRGGALDRARDPAPPRPLAHAEDRARRVLPRRVAVPGRSVAHGRQALPALRV